MVPMTHSPLYPIILTIDNHFANVWCSYKRSIKITPLVSINTNGVIFMQSIPPLK